MCRPIRSRIGTSGARCNASAHANASDAPSDATPKTWCESRNPAPALCLDYDEGTLTQGFAAGQPFTFQPPSQTAGTATLAPGKGVDALQLEGTPSGVPADVGQTLTLPPTPHRVFDFSFAIRLNTIDSAAVAPQFLANVSVATDCAFALLIIPGTRVLVLRRGFAGGGISPAPSGLALPASGWVRVGLQAATNAANGANLDVTLSLDTGGGTPTTFLSQWNGASCPATGNVTPSFSLALHADPPAGTTRVQYDEVVVRTL